jgi:ankyrin repeat protein
LFCYALFFSKIASYNGYTDIVAFLLKDKRVNPSEDYNLTIRDAAEHGHFDIVELLLNDSRIDPSDFSNDAIYYASKNGHNEILKTLWKQQRVKNTLKKDHYKLHNELIKKDIKNKIEHF